MKKNILFFLFIMTATLSGCYYDNVEELHPGLDKACLDANSSDTLTYNSNVKWIIDGSCGTTGSQGSNCHNSNRITPLSTYSELKICINDTINKTFIKDIKHESGAHYNMPQNGGKLTDCQIKVIENWINQGMPEN